MWDLELFNWRISCNIGTPYFTLTQTGLFLSESSFPFRVWEPKPDARAEKIFFGTSREKIRFMARVDSEDFSNHHNFNRSY